MISFVSFFLGLLLGPQTVEVAVTDGVAAVRIELDGRIVGTMEASPWRLVCDFGPELAPHELVAVALDERGVELDRAQRWINLPRRPAEAEIVLEGGENGQERTARISWETLAGIDPPALEVIFDGRQIPANDPGAIRLPAHDPQQLHFLRAELEFEGNLSSVVELTFGGAYADRVNAELTALPIVLDDQTSLPTPEALDGWFIKGDRPLRVVALDRGAAEIVMVRDRATQEKLDLVGRSRQRMSQALRRKRLPSRQRARRDWRLQFIWPVSRRQRGSDRIYDLFPHSRELTSADGDLYLLLYWIRQPLDLTGPQRLANAVALAGLAAAGGKGRRAVVLLLGEDPSDRSDLPPALAQRYLERLQVPLVVWTTARQPGKETLVWGQPRLVSNSAGLDAAWRELLESLEHQRIVWLEGIHLPQEVRLSERAEGIRIAG